MPAIDALLLKHQLLEDMVGGYWSGYMRFFIDDLAGRTGSGNAPNTDFEGTDLTGVDVTRQMMRDLQMSHAYYVSPEMSVLTTAASERMTEQFPNEPVRAEDFPTAQGFLWIPNGLVHLDIRAQPVETSAVLWSIYGGQVHFVFLADKFHVVDRARLEERDRVERNPNGTWFNEMPRLTPWHLMSQPLGQPIASALLMLGVIPPEDARDITFTRAPNGALTMTAPKGFGPEQMVPHTQPEPVVAWVMTCLRLMMQPRYVQTRRIEVPANLRRRFRTSKVRMKNNLASIIEYRRAEGFHETGTGREFSHRFLRTGHWRNQRYKPDGPGTDWDYKIIWIHDAIVGDPSKPLILREHVKAFVH